MLKIKKTTEKRALSQEEFLKLKGEEPFAQYRQIAKSLNFLLIFGGSPRVFVQSALEMNWSHSRVLAFIKENNLEGLREKLFERFRQRDTSVMIDYITVATHMRNNFFKLYKGLMERIDKNRAFARDAGYARSVFGITRKMIAYMLQGEYDSQEDSLRLNNLANIAANTDIQAFESAVINQALVRIEREFLDRGMRSVPFNNVHDSLDFYVPKEELGEFVKIVKDTMTEAIPELRGIPLEVDFSIGDLTKGDYYKVGKPYEHYLST